MRKTGILIINLGTPNQPNTKEVRSYLKQFLLDGRVIDIHPFFRQLLVRGIVAPFRAPKSAALYQKLWTPEGSPLKYFGESVVRQLQNLFDDSYKVELAMRYQNPSIEAALESLKKFNADRIVVFTMFPQYASASTGSALEEVMRILSSWQTIPEVRMISSYHDNEAMLDLYVENAKATGLHNYDHFLFSYHGIPQSQLKKADHNNHCLQSSNCCQSICESNKMCYSAQCFHTSRILASKLELTAEQYSVGFQSRLGPDKWTEPFTPDVLKQLLAKGKKRLLVFSPSFTSDCLETTIEIGMEYHEEFLEMGGEKLDLVKSLNDDPQWVQVIYQIIKSHT